MKGRKELAQGWFGVSAAFTVLPMKLEERISFCLGGQSRRVIMKIKSTWYFHEIRE